MAIGELGKFMNALGQVESGNRYDAVGPNTGSTYGRARGRYQIMETIWPGWAREAGVDPNDTSPAAQDRVAAFKLSQYYNRYGSWDLVSVAWFAGPGRANKAMKAGVKSLKGIADITGTDVPKYVRLVNEAMGKAPDRLVPAGESPATGVEADAPTAETQTDPNQQFVEERQRQSSLMSAIMQQVSDRARIQGGRVLDVAAMFGDSPNYTPSEEPAAGQVLPDTLPPAPGAPQEAV